VVQLLGAIRGERERRAIYLGPCAGRRRQELLGLQGRHFMRDGFGSVSADIAKGKRERWVPIIAELAREVADLRRTLATDDFALPAQRWRDPGVNRREGRHAEASDVAEGAAGVGWS
jgi:integrase